MASREQPTIPGLRYLVVRGRSTALRLALPQLGSLSIGSSPANDLRIRETGVAPEHALVYLDHGIGVRFLDADSARISGDSDPKKERRVSVGETVELELGDRVRIGAVELIFAPALDSAPAQKILTRAYFESRPKGSGTVARVRVRGNIPAESIEAAISARLSPGDLVALLGPGEYAISFAAVTESHAHGVISELARALAHSGGEVLAGIAESSELEPAKLLELAGTRMSRPSLAARARLASSRDSTMQGLEKMVDRIAKSSAHVLILGETGVGKDIIAQTIHDRSERANGPFVRVNCVDLSDQFLEEAATNFLARARGGTVHLDEVAGLSARAQLSLGYLLDEAPSTGHDVRFLATSNQDLNAHVASGSFRKDLFFRLNQVTITVPPLRSRAADIIPLAELFIARAADASQRSSVPKLSAQAAQLLGAYSWPGNTRELNNVIERALLLSPGDVIGVEALPPEIAGAQSAGGGAELSADTDEEDLAGGTGRPGSLREEIAALEKKRILEALQKYPTQRDAAAALDMPMRTFLNRLDALGIPRARGGGSGGKQG